MCVRADGGGDKNGVSSGSGAARLWCEAPAQSKERSDAQGPPRGDAEESEVGGKCWEG
jgi:hypothetical protein